MLNFLLQIQPSLPQQTQPLPELPTGPSFDRIRGPVEIPFLENWQVALISTLSLILLCWIVWGLVRVSSKKRNSTSKMLPNEAAMADLKSAAELTSGNDEQFSVLSALALRRYFGTHLELDVLSQTTDEFLISLGEQPLKHEDATQPLAECLHHFDQVKFAQVSLSSDERSQLTAKALQLIQDYEKLLSETTTEIAQP